MIFNSILKELKNIPSDKIEELHQFINSLKLKKKRKEQFRKKILAFAGSFSNISKKEYADFLKQAGRDNFKHLPTTN